MRSHDPTPGDLQGPERLEGGWTRGPSARIEKREARVGRGKFPRHALGDSGRDVRVGENPGRPGMARERHGPSQLDTSVSVAMSKEVEGRTAAWVTDISKRETETQGQKAIHRREPVAKAKSGGTEENPAKGVDETAGSQLPVTAADQEYVGIATAPIRARRPVKSGAATVVGGELGCFSGMLVATDLERHVRERGANPFAALCRWADEPRYVEGGCQHAGSQGLTLAQSIRERVVEVTDQDAGSSVENGPWGRSKGRDSRELCIPKEGGGIQWSEELALARNESGRVVEVTDREAGLCVENYSDVLEMRSKGRSPRGMREIDNEAQRSKELPLARSKRRVVEASDRKAEISVENNRSDVQEVRSRVRDPQRRKDSTSVVQQSERLTPTQYDKIQGMEKDTSTRASMECDQMVHSRACDSLVNNEEKTQVHDSYVDKLCPFLVNEPEESILAAPGGMKCNRSQKERRKTKCDVTFRKIIGNTRNDTPGQSSGSLSMVTEGVINGIRVDILNDTGAQVSVLSKSFAERAGVQWRPAEDGIRIENPNGDTLGVEGVAEVEIIHGTKKYGGKFYVIGDVKTDVIVGEPFLVEHNACLHVGRAEILYGSNPIPTKPIRNSNRKKYWATHVAKVVLKENTRVAGNSVNQITVTAPDIRDASKGLWNWLFTPIQIFCEEGLYWPEAAVKIESDGTFRIGVCNQGKNEVILRKGSCVGTLYTVLEVRALSVKINVGEKPTQDDQMAKFEEAWTKQIQGMSIGVSPHMKDEIRKMSIKHIDTLCAKQIGRVNDILMDIDVQGNQPIQTKERRYTPKEREAIKKEVDMMLKLQVIEPATSPWASRLVMVPKKDGSIRTCIDFRGVNELCVKDAYPNPNVYDTLEKLRGALWFTSFDAEKGYYQIGLTERAKDITAFRAQYGLYRFNRMPFGLKNAGAVFNRVMHRALGDIIGKCCMVFVDDIIVFSNTWEEHIEHIDMVLTRLQKIGMTVNFIKSALARDEMPFLGHVVTRQGIKPDPRKVIAVKSFVRPKTLKGLRSFLGLTGYLRRFIRGYAKIAAPLIALTADSAKEKWSRDTAWGLKEEEAFERLKSEVTDQASLSYPVFDEPFCIICDASDIGAGAMLAQINNEGAEQPIAFASCTFNKAQRNYSATEKEGLAVVWAVQHFRPYIHGAQCVVVTDHSALTWIMTRKDPPQRLARWVMALMDYDLTFVHRKGKDNVVADALSRLKSTREENVDETGEGMIPITVHNITENTIDKIKDGKSSKEWLRAQEKDKNYGAMIRWLKGQRYPKDEDMLKWVVAQEDKYVLQDGLLKYIDITQEGRSKVANTLTVVPPNEVQQLVARYHESPSLGAHQGTRRIYPKIREKYWWPRMYSDIKEQIMACTVCQAVGKSTAQKSRIGGHAIGGDPFEYIAMDLLSLPESYAGHRYAMIVMDYHSRYSIVAPLRTKEAEEVAQALIRNVIMVYGPPKKLLTDNGGEFKNKVLNEICQALRVKRKFTSPYNPQADGMVERFNRTLLRMLACYIEPNQRNWDLIVPMVVYAYNTTSCNAHGLTPFEVIFGRKGRTGEEEEVEGPRNGEEQYMIDKYREDLRQYVNEVTRQGKGIEEQKANQRRKEPTIYNAGDLVWLSSHIKVEEGGRRKLGRKWRGPYVVLNMAGDVNVRLKEVASNGSNFVTHVDGIKPFKKVGGNAKIAVNDQVDNDSLDADEKSEEGTYAVEAVTQHRFMSGTLQFKVKWEGFSEQTWVDEDKMDCFSKVEEYFRNKSSQSWGEGYSK